MELIRGHKPLTAIERAVAAELHRALKPEIDVSRDLHPDLLAYERGFLPYGCRREMSEKEIAEKRGARLRYFREWQKRRRARARAQ